MGTVDVDAGLDHLFVIGGTPSAWAALSDDDWSALARRLGLRAAAAGARWLTIRPFGPDAEHPESGAGVRRTYDIDGAQRCTVIVDPTTDGRVAFAAAAARLTGGDAVEEKAIARHLYAPADAEPDLIVVLGNTDRLPPSLVWELAYGELVFIDGVSLVGLEAAELDAAIAAFRSRNRRFGGLDG